MWHRSSCVIFTDIRSVMTATESIKFESREDLSHNMILTSCVYNYLNKNKNLNSVRTSWMVSSGENTGLTRGLYIFHLLSLCPRVGLRNCELRRFPLWPLLLLVPIFSIYESSLIENFHFAIFCWKNLNEYT